MPRIEPITDADDPRVDVYRAQTDAWLRAAHHPDAGAGATGTGYTGGVFMAEGELVLGHLLASRYEPESVFLTARRLESLGPRLDALPAGVPVYVAERAVMAAVCGFDIHRGVLAAARRGDPADALAIAERARTLVVLEDLANHDNVGSIFRSAAALVGLDRVGVVLSPRCCDPLYRKAIRVSMGLALRVPFATMDDWPGGLSRLRELGYETIALTPGAGAEDLACARDPGRPRPGASDPPRTAIVIGDEGPGLSRGTLDACSRRVRIPIAEGVDSLNAGVAAAIALHALLAPERF
ncbi:MAG: RNA methyltransferase [Phycisphaerales bacterium]